MRFQQFGLVRSSGYIPKLVFFYTKFHLCDSVSLLISSGELGVDTDLLLPPQTAPFCIFTCLLHVCPPFLTVLPHSQHYGVHYKCTIITELVR